jgi:hypothetical protein
MHHICVGRRHTKTHWKWVNNKDGGKWWESAVEEV